MSHQHVIGRRGSTDVLGGDGLGIAADHAIEPTTFLAQSPELEAALRDFFAGRAVPRRFESRDGSQPRETVPLMGNCELPTFAVSSDGRQPHLPRMFGRYRIDRRLGAGGMGIVFLAHDTELHRDVALKLPRFAVHEKREVIERFYREARAAAVLQHPYICPIYDIGEIDGTKFISMGYIKGRTLAEIVRSGRLPGPTAAAKLVQMLAGALAEAHEHGIVHRDLTPANIIINHRQHPIIVDFGLAKRLAANGAAVGDLTPKGTVLGTPAYMSPEQIKGTPDQVGPSTDIYSLGVVLFRLLTGRLPYQGSFAAVLGSIVAQDPPRPSNLRPGIDPALDAVCLCMMARSPRDRFPDMRSVVDALSGVLSQEASGERIAAPRMKATVSV